MRIKSSKDAKWIGRDISACAISLPCASAIAVEWSWRSLMLVEKAVFWMVIQHSSLIDLRPLHTISNVMGSRSDGCVMVDPDHDVPVLCNAKTTARRHQCCGIVLRYDERSFQCHSWCKPAALDERDVNRSVGAEPDRAGDERDRWRMNLPDAQPLSGEIRARLARRHAHVDDLNGRGRIMMAVLALMRIEECLLQPIGVRQRFAPRDGDRQLEVLSNISHIEDNVLRASGPERVALVEPLVGSVCQFGRHG